MVGCWQGLTVVCDKCRRHVHICWLRMFGFKPRIAFLFSLLCNAMRTIRTTQYGKTNYMLMISANTRGPKRKFGKTDSASWLRQCHGSELKLIFCFYYCYSVSLTLKSRALPSQEVKEPLSQTWLSHLMLCILIYKFGPNLSMEFTFYHMKTLQHKIESLRKLYQ